MFIKGARARLAPSSIPLSLSLSLSLSRMCRGWLACPCSCSLCSVTTKWIGASLTVQHEQMGVSWTEKRVMRGVLTMAVYAEPVCGLRLIGSGQVVRHTSSHGAALVNNEDPAADHWCIYLCRRQIEYIEATHQRGLARNIFIYLNMIIYLTAVQ
jgi:hypothetical protein